MDRYTELIRFLTQIAGFKDEPWAREYFEFIIPTGQFYAYTHNDEIIAFLDYWFFNDKRFAEMYGKNWRKPFPLKVTQGDNAYVNVAAVKPGIKNVNLLLRFLKDGQDDYPNLKSICWHDEEGKWHKHVLGGNSNERDIQQTQSTVCSVTSSNS